MFGSISFYVGTGVRGFVLPPRGFWEDRAISQKKNAVNQSGFVCDRHSAVEQEMKEIKKPGLTHA